MPELIPADRTVRALIVALLDFDLDAEVEIFHQDGHRAFRLISVAEQASTGFGQQYITLKVHDA